MTMKPRVAPAAGASLVVAATILSGMSAGVPASATTSGPAASIPLVFEDGTQYRTSKPIAASKEGNSTRSYASYASAAAATGYYEPYSVTVRASSTPGWFTLTSGSQCLGVRTLASFGYGSSGAEVPGFVSCSDVDAQRWQLNDNGRLVNKSRGAVGRVFTTANPWPGGGYHYQMGFGGTGLRLAGDVSAFDPIDNGGLVAHDGPPVDLVRGTVSDVFFGVRFTGSADQVKGTFTLTAPRGTTFADGQQTVTGEYRLPGESEWKTSPSLTLTDGTLSADRTTLSYNIDTKTGSGIPDELFRWAVKVAPGDADEGAAQLGYSFSGSTSAGNSKVDGRTPVTIPAPSVENGGISAGSVPSTELRRGSRTEVPLIIENDAAQTSLTGKVSFDAPVGLTFAPQTTADGEYRQGDTGAWKGYAPLQLRNGALSNGGRTITFDLAATSGRYEVGEQYRWRVLVDTPADTTIERSAIRWSVTGTASAGSFSVDGTSAVTVEPVSAAPLVIASPADGSTVRTDSKRVVFSGTGAPGARVQVLTQTPSPRAIIDTFVLADGTWSQLGSDLNFGVAYSLDTVYTPQGAEPVLGVYHLTLEAADPGVSQPFAILTPPNDSEVVAPDKRVDISGVGTTGTEVSIWNSRSKDRLVGTTAVGQDGTWTIAATLNNEDTRYELHVEYRVPGEGPRERTHVLLVKARDGQDRPFAFDSPAEDSTVITPTGSVDFEGVGATGAKVVIWNYASKDRVVARATVDAHGMWKAAGSLNNRNGEYFLHVEYTVPGQRTVESTRHVFIKPEASTDRPFSVAAPAEGETVTLSNFRQSDRNGEATVSGDGATGGIVKVWNYSTKDRLVTRGGELTVDEDGRWTGTAELRDQDYSLFVEYFAPGADTDSEPTRTATRTFTAVAPRREG